MGLRNINMTLCDKTIKTERCPWKSVSVVLVYEPQTTKACRQESAGIPVDSVMLEKLRARQEKTTKKQSLQLIAA